MRIKTPPLLLCAGLAVCLAACEQAVRDVTPDPGRQARLANMRSRAFDTADRDRVLRAALAALQDLGFHIDRVDYKQASVSGTKLDHYLLRLSVTVVAQDANRSLVRANARYDVTPVLEPEPYQKFFAVLSRSLALEARAVD